MKRRLHAAGTKRVMRISGVILIASWLVIAYTISGISADATMYQMGRLGALGLVGIALIIISFFIKEKKKKEQHNT